MLTGYARVSTDDQNLRLQCDLLTEAGCRRIVEAKVSGARRDRPELVRLLDQIRADDVPPPAMAPAMAGSLPVFDPVDCIGITPDGATL